MIGEALAAPSKHTFVSDAILKFATDIRMIVANTFRHIVKEGVDSGSFLGGSGLAV